MKYIKVSAMMKVHELEYKGDLLNQKKIREKITSVKTRKKKQLKQENKKTKKNKSKEKQKSPKGLKKCRD